MSVLIFCLFSVSSEVVVYDWTEVGDPEIVVEDLERLDLDKYTIYDTQMSDWRRQDKWDWNNSRQMYKYQLINNLASRINCD